MTHRLSYRLNTSVTLALCSYFFLPFYLQVRTFRLLRPPLQRILHLHMLPLATWCVRSLSLSTHVAVILLSGSLEVRWPSEKKSWNEIKETPPARHGISARQGRKFTYSAASGIDQNFTDRWSIANIIVWNLNIHHSNRKRATGIEKGRTLESSPPRRKENSQPKTWLDFTAENNAHCWWRRCTIRRWGIPFVVCKRSLTDKYKRTRRLVNDEDRSN